MIRETEVIRGEAKKLHDTFTGLGSTSAVGRTQMKMMALQLEVLLDVRDCLKATELKILDISQNTQH